MDSEPIEGQEPELEPIPRGQTWFDKLWLLFLISLALSLILYNLWGLIDLMNVPPAPY
ncbi:MAG: hypothetical protein R3335_10980 [Anaerolineales bacterium]|nr:hypothetical protein [Anaerolineales bacterium]